MSYESRQTIDVTSTHENQSISNYQRNTYFGVTVQQTSAIVIDLPALQIDLQEQYQREKTALNELNQRFQLFVDRIHTLQNQNAKYLIEIAERRGQISGVSTSHVEEGYVSYRSNYSSIANARLDADWDFELYQLQIGIYQRLIEIEQQTKDKRIPILEDELKQLKSTLISVRTSYEQLQKIVDNLQGENARLLQQYLGLTNEWCSIRKQRKKWDLHMETLRSYIGFYKNLRANYVVESKSLTMASDDQFWRLELDKIIQAIRRDFEAFYAEIYKQMTVYYQVKREEAEVNLKQAVNYQHVEIERFTMVQQKWQVEYEKTQATLTYEKEIYLKLENTHNQLAAEYQSIRAQYDERAIAQVNDLQTVHENIMALAYDVDEMRRSKGNLELEIIIYRQLLSAAGIETPAMVISRVAEPIVHEQTGKVMLRRQKKGPVGIKECAPNGTYISLTNSSTNRTIDVSRWSITREVDRRMKFRYTIPDGILLEPGRELRIYAKVGNTTSFESGTYQRLVSNNLASWGEGNSSETLLFNQNGEEESSYVQSTVTQRI